MKTYLIGVLLALCIAGPAASQNASVNFGEVKHDPSEPVEITADELSVDQQSGEAVFTGNVVAGQGELRLTAATVTVEYTKDGGDIDRLLASGGVTLVNGGEAAEAQNAVYAVGSGEIVMTGEVLLTQGPNAISGEKLIVDLNTGQGQMVGRVRTIFKTGGN